jgi:hypothetical protein
MSKVEFIPVSELNWHSNLPSFACTGTYTAKNGMRIPVELRLNEHSLSTASGARSRDGWDRLTVGQSDRRTVDWRTSPGTAVKFGV